MGFDNAYEAISEQNDETRWAFGTGFVDPLAEVTVEDRYAVPPGVDPDDLATYHLMLGDDALIASHRLQEWCTRAPELEEEVALANIALDLLGQARPLLSAAGGIAAAADGGPVRDEDQLAFFRSAHEFRNVRLVELAAGDFAFSVAWLLVFSSWRLAVLSRLRDSASALLAAVAAKAVKEVTYHRDHAANWLVRLGDGTELSHARAQVGLDAVWPWVDELFVPHPVEVRLAEAGVGVDVSQVRAECDSIFDQVFQTATLRRPEVAAVAGVSGRTGRDGVHTEALGFLLAELQYLPRSDPAATW